MTSRFTRKSVTDVTEERCDRSRQTLDARCHKGRGQFRVMIRSAAEPEREEGLGLGLEGQCTNSKLGIQPESSVAYIFVQH